MGETEAYFKNASEHWSDRYRSEPKSIWDLDLILRREHVQMIVGSLIKNSNKDRLRVLDVGCGTGDSLQGISRDVVEVEGFDVVQEMVDVASQNNPEDTYAVRDIYDLPFEPGRRDIILCLGVLEYLDNPKESLKAFAEELAPDGSLVVSFPNGSSILRSLTSAIVWMEEFLATTIRRLQGRERRTTLNRYKHYEWSPRDIEQSLIESGFRIEQFYYNTFGLGGRIGGLKPSISLSRWLTGRFRNARTIGNLFGLTIVVHASPVKD